jgi:predicted nucleic acid-binding protein
MAVSHLLDTSVLTRLGAPEVRAVVEPLAAMGRMACAGISDLEIGYSARSGGSGINSPVRSTSLLGGNHR